MKQQYPGLSIGDCAKKLGEMWSKLSQSEKQPYEEKAQKLREKYDRVRPRNHGDHHTADSRYNDPLPVSCVCDRTWWRTAAAARIQPGTPAPQLREERKRRMTKERTKTMRTMMTSREEELQRERASVCV